jgi:sortase A
LSLAVSKDPRLVIPKINVDVKVNYDATPDNDSQMKAMETGVAYFGIAGANSKPGQNGNVPIAGHSSNDALAPGDPAVKFIFAQLEQMKKGDAFYLNYKGTRYTYSVTKIMVVTPSQVSKLQIGKGKPYATLITCTPLGTAEKRLLVFGEQISPSPTNAVKAPTSVDASTDAPELAGKSPTLFEQLFGN